MSKKPIVLEAHHLTKTYTQGAQDLHIFQDMHVQIHQGELVGLMGPSGSGKSTLLNILGLLDKPTDGSVFINGTIIDFHKDTIMTQLRQQSIGFVFQFHHLLLDFTALENVMMPLLIRGITPSIAAEEAHAYLTRVGLQDRITHRPGQLSGGEQQRVALARALVGKPQLLLADEPTGNLDPDTAEHVFNLLLNLCAQAHIAVIMATHNPHFIKRMSDVITLGG